MIYNFLLGLYQNATLYHYSYLQIIDACSKTLFSSWGCVLFQISGKVSAIALDTLKYMYL